jgi:hypothetical protein
VVEAERPWTKRLMGREGRRGGGSVAATGARGVGRGVKLRLQCFSTCTTGTHNEANFFCSPRQALGKPSIQALGLNPGCFDTHWPLRGGVDRNQMG